MPLFSRVAVKLCPQLLRWIRVALFMDCDRLRQALPAHGHVIELGCGYGHVLAMLAAHRPDLQFTGLDIDPTAIAAARDNYPLPNLNFRLSTDMPDETATVVLALHVIHHCATPTAEQLLVTATRVLQSNGLLVMEEMAYEASRLGVFLDRYVSRCPPILRTDEELRRLLPSNLEPVGVSRFRKAAITRVWLTARKRGDAPAIRPC